MDNLITPDLKQGELSFEANGKKYLVEAKLSIARKIECDKLILELSVGGTLAETASDWKKVFEMLNARTYADAAVVAHNRIEGIKKWEERHDPILSLCALYINEESEDRRTITDERIKSKIKDWEEAGIEYGFFLNAAKALLKGLTENWSSISQNTSETLSA